MRITPNEISIEMRTSPVSASPSMQQPFSSERHGDRPSRSGRAELDARHPIAAPRRLPGVEESALPRASDGRFLDVIVLGGAGCVAVAAAFILTTQLGLSWEIAAAVGLGVLAMAATLHFLLKLDLLLSLVIRVFRAEVFELLRVTIFFFSSAFLIVLF